MDKQEKIKEEVWRPCVGYEGFYEVSNFGNVRSVDRQKRISHGKIGFHKGRSLKPLKNKYGYMKVSLSTDVIYKTVNVHRLVATTFIPNPENKPQVNHINGDKSNNHIDNLEWVTRDENMQHAHKTGLMNLASGIQHHNYNIKPSKHPRAKSIINIKTKAIYGSIKEAYKDSGVNESTFRGWLRENKNEIWMYYDDYINNNGWIKIETEEDLPNQNIDCWVMFSDGTISVDSYHFQTSNFIRNHKSNIKFYQPIEKPKKPIY